MSNAANAYARVAQTTAAPGDMEAQALLQAARRLEEVKANWNGADKRLRGALHFNRQLWSIFMSAASNAENPQPLEVRQNIANIGIFVMNQTLDVQVNPEPSQLNSLIEINCNIAAGLSGRG